MLLESIQGGGISTDSKDAPYLLRYFHRFLYLGYINVLYRFICYIFTPKIWLVIGIVFNLALLGYFKYTGFLLENLIDIATYFHIDSISAYSLPHIVLPLALSFITFQQIAFLCDCYAGKVHKRVKLIDYCLFITFFPQLIAGPIVHHQEMMPQFAALKSRPLFMFSHIARGIFIFCIGLFKKCFIADSLGKWADSGFSAVENGAVLNTLESWAVSLSYTFELYFDFSGYCDMALGLGLLFGITLPLNFLSPYKSANISVFWRTWHITLGRFFKQYVYIPLGGNHNPAHKHKKHFHRINRLLTLRNLFIVAFLSGIWHGAGWGFVIWGVMHGLALCTHRIYGFFIESLKDSISHTNTTFTDSANTQSNSSPTAYDDKSYHHKAFYCRAEIERSESEVSRTCEALATCQNIESVKTKNNILPTAQHNKADSINLYTYAKTTQCNAISHKHCLPSHTIRAQDSQDDKNSHSFSILNRLNLAFKMNFLHFIESRFYKLLCVFLTFIFVNIAWVFFRAESVHGAFNLLKGMFSFHIVLPRFLESYVSQMPFVADSIYFNEWAQSINESALIVWGSLMLVCVVVWGLKNSAQIAKPRSIVAFVALGCGFFYIALTLLAGNEDSIFLYFNF